MTVTKYRRPLNPEQLAVLQWLYQYRFSTSKQLATHLLKPNPKAIQNKLQILEQQGFIGKHYDKSYKLAGRAAEYFLTPKGARQLPADSVNEWAIKSLYKNKTVSPDFITHCLNVADVALQLQAIYGDKLGIFTRSHMVAYDYFPSWTPDLFLNLKAGSTRRRYFLDVWDDTKPFFVSVRKIRNYTKDEDEGDWYEDTPYPYILAVCIDEKVQKKLGGQIRHALNDTYSELTFATTTLKRLRKSAKPTDQIWSKIETSGEDERLSLRSLYS